MVKLLWLSRHPLTNGQQAMLNTLGYEDVEQVNLLFGDNPIGQVKELGDVQEIALVAPTHISLALLRAGYRLIEFVNEPSSRQKGVFLCKGAWRHLLESSEWFPCPISPEEQEEGDISPISRG